MLVNSPPATVNVRGRVVLAYLVASLAASYIIVGFAPPRLLGQRLSRLWGEPLLWVVFYALLLAPLLRPGSEHARFLRRALSPRPNLSAVRWAIATGVGLVAISTALLFATVIPLSYVAPDFVQSLILDDQTPVFATRGYLYPLANLVTLLTVTVLGPFVEEAYFRGLLLQPWSLRFGPKRAIVLSAAIFALFHPAIGGAFVFGIVTAIAALRTRTLWLPIIIHATNNGVTCLGGAAELLSVGEPTRTLADLQASWWIGLVGLAVGVPLLIWALRRIPEPRNDSGPRVLTTDH